MNGYDQFKLQLVIPTELNNHYSYGVEPSLGINLENLHCQW